MLQDVFFMLAGPFLIDFLILAAKRQRRCIEFAKHLQEGVQGDCLLKPQRMFASAFQKLPGGCLVDCKSRFFQLIPDHCASGVMPDDKFGFFPSDLAGRVRLIGALISHESRAVNA